MIHRDNLDQNTKPQSQSQDKQAKSCNICSVICLIIIILANLTLFIYIFKYADLNTITKMNFPANYKGQICSLNYTKTNPYIYIDLEHSEPIYRCVGQCPTSWNQFTIKDSQNNQLISSFPQEHINMQLGGICWSQAKQQMLKERNLQSQILQKYNILINIKNIFLIILFSFGLSTLLLIYYSLSSSKVSIIIPIILACILLALTLYFAYIKYSYYHMLIIIFFSLTLVVYMLNILFFKDQLFHSMDFQAIFSQRYRRGQETTCGKHMKALGIILLFNVINIVSVMVVIGEFILLISTQELKWSDNSLYYYVDKTVWKYAVLILIWYINSHIIFQLYSLIITQMGYRINLGQKMTCCKAFNCWNILLAVSFSVVLTFGVIPIKLVQFLKPNGALVRQHHEETCCNKISQFSYCCFGVIVNIFHKFTFNPFLVNTIDSKHYNLLDSLSRVQGIYHQAYPSQDRCSQWLYRLSNYIIISLISILLLNLMSQQTESVLPLLQLVIFYLIIVVISNEVSRLNVNFWSICTQVSQFIEISHQINKRNNKV